MVGEGEAHDGTGPGNDHGGGSDESIDSNRGEDSDEPMEIERRYRKIFQHSNDAIMIVDIESESFVDVNPAACDMLGYTRDELLEMDPASIHPDDFDRVREEFIREVVEKGTGFTDDLYCLTNGGDEIPTEISGAALDTTSDGGQPRRMVAILRDISDRVARRRELQAKVERLDRFASIVSHDLRNPLSIIRANVELAQRDGELERLE